jgi:ribose 5-phosphate isomerase A
VLGFGLAPIRAGLARVGLVGSVRQTEGGGTYQTDEGNPVLDVALTAEHHPAAVDELLDRTPGVVGHGLFLKEADAVLIEHPDGRIEQRERA